MQTATVKTTAQILQEAYNYHLSIIEKWNATGQRRDDYKHLLDAQDRLTARLAEHGIDLKTYTDFVSKRELTPSDLPATSHLQGV